MSCGERTGAQLQAGAGWAVRAVHTRQGSPAPNPAPAAGRPLPGISGLSHGTSEARRGCTADLSQAPVVEQGGKLLEIPHSRSCTRSVTAEKHSTVDPAEDKLKHKSHRQQVAVQQHEPRKARTLTDGPISCTPACPMGP